MRRRGNTSSLSTSVSVPWQPWKRKCQPYSAEKLLIPLPIPHPAHIAITIHNRDSEDPIPLDLELCQNILRAVEEAHYDASGTTEEVVNVARYRGGDANGDESVKGSESSVGEEVGYSWHSSDWSARRRNNSGSIRVDLASPEDVTLDTDTSRVMFSSYGTTV